ncbi:hypothetical protein Tco_0496719 [Tanacetum coccineum]
MAKVVPALAPQGHARNMERVGPEERPPRMDPIASKAAQGTHDHQLSVILCLINPQMGWKPPCTEGALHLGPEQDRVFADLMPKEKERFKADIHVTNILLQGLPKDIYTLINHYTDAKDIWDNENMLLEGSELTKDERESQLYNAFEHFLQNKGESIHEYYVREQRRIHSRILFQNGRVVVQNVQARHNRGQGNYARGAVATGNGGV